MKNKTQVASAATLLHVLLNKALMLMVDTSKKCDVKIRVLKPWPMGCLSPSNVPCMALVHFSKTYSVNLYDEK
jgi:hypothetical protein